MILRSAASRTLSLYHVASGRCISTARPLHPVVKDLTDVMFDILGSSTGINPEPRLPGRAMAPPSFPSVAVPELPAVISEATAPSRAYVLPKADPLLSFIASLIMRHGLLHRARQNVADTLSYIASKTHTDPLALVRRAVLLASPSVRVVTHRRSAKSVIMPYALGERQRARQGIQWILAAAEKRGEKGNKSLSDDKWFHLRFGNELMAVVNGSSSVLQRKEEVHRQAMLNRSNAQVRPGPGGQMVA